MQKECLPSEIIADFLNHITAWRDEHKEAFEGVGKEDKRLQDLLHDLEFTANAKEKNRVATNLKESRKTRREYKDKVQMLESIVQFFEDEQNAKVLNKLTQLLGKQRKNEEYIFSDRSYRYRVIEEKETIGKVVKK